MHGLPVFQLRVGPDQPAAWAVWLVDLVMALQAPPMLVPSMASTGITFSATEISSGDGVLRLLIEAFGSTIFCTWGVLAGLSADMPHPHVDPDFHTSVLSLLIAAVVV